MVLAAGVGSRLRPLTDTTPKALLQIGGAPMIERVIRRLKTAGVTELVVNLFHLADRIVEFLASQGNFGIRIAFTRETDLLDTGGGLKNAAWFFEDGRPFFLHNVDVLSDIDLEELYRFHQTVGGLATLAIQHRRSTRQLLFERDGRLCGRVSPEGVEWTKGPMADVERLAFTGIHVIDPAIFPRMTETGAFPITRTYLRLAGEGERINAYRADGRYWQDIGSFEQLEDARKRVVGGTDVMQLRQ
ncbi:MAG TPA: nucleotidyltransferase family protein [Candidatus Methylomirabilis sp.]|nr:nucleotidyltransferase family protein [Candidatus Methylomirabilis sp.]